MKLKSLLAGSIVSLTLVSGAHAAGEVNVYSYRQQELIQPMIDAFSARHDIDVNVIFAKKGMLEKLMSEGANSPADVLFTVDIGRA
ncbi:MAG: iron ABC transporter substrate-binding protein, partial [Gammaproteobacteria bacterium]|nr:iron ABC transporter substrate-binding protein [Gammaproteobacteria bacterium]